MPKNGLTDKQRLFIAEYRKDGNGKQAAIRAGYAPRTAEVTASKLLRLAKVRQELEEQTTAALAPIEVTADKVQQALAEIAFGTVLDFYDKDTGNLVPTHELDERPARRVASVKVMRERTHATTDGVTEISTTEQLVELKFIDKVKPLELLGKTFGMFVDRQVIQADVSLLAICRAISAERDGKAIEGQTVDG